MTLVANTAIGIVGGTSVLLRGMYRGLSPLLIQNIIVQRRVFSEAQDD
jgi:hypothetical protein